MSTKEKLAKALEGAGLLDMARKARRGYYHDFESDLPDPARQLDMDLLAAHEAGFFGAAALRKQHHNGDFDADLDESDAWAASEEGKAVLGQIAAETGVPVADGVEVDAERMKIANLLAGIMRGIHDVAPRAAITILVQREGAPGFDCATTYRKEDFVAALRVYADQIEKTQEGKTDEA